MLLDCKYEEEKEISFVPFFFLEQNRNFETETDLECHLSIGRWGWHQDSDDKMTVESNNCCWEFHVPGTILDDLRLLLI